MYTMSVYTMSDGKNNFFLHCYTNIKRKEAPVWLDISDGWSKLKGCLLLWMSLAFYCSKVIVWEMREKLLSPKKIGFLAKHCTFNFDLHHDLKTSCFDSNPTESSAIDRAPFRI